MRRNRGSVFVVTLAVLAGLVALVAGVAASHREGAHAESRRLEDRRAQIMAEAGIQHAIALLQQKANEAAQKSDSWANAGSAGKVGYTIDTDSYRFQILDAGSRLNINSAQEDQFKKLSLTPEQIAAILDWREGQKVARSSGAKDEYYNLLPNPYNTKLKNFDCVEELLLVKGITPAMLFTGAQPGQGGSSTVGFSGEMLTTDSNSADLTPSGKAKVNLSQATVADLIGIGVPEAAANALTQSRPGSLADALRNRNATQAARALADSATVGTDTEHPGLINVNTAPESVLATLPGVAADVAASIVSRQSVGFKSLGELLDVPGIDANTLAGFIDRVCVGSRAFLVRSMGISGSSLVSVEAALRIDTKGAVHVDRIRNAPYGDMSKLWKWDAQTSSKVEMGGFNSAAN